MSALLMNPTRVLPPRKVGGAKGLAPSKSEASFEKWRAAIPCRRNVLAAIFGSLSTIVDGQPSSMTNLLIKLVDCLPFPLLTERATCSPLRERRDRIPGSLPAIAPLRRSHAKARRRRVDERRPLQKSP